MLIARFESGVSLAGFCLSGLLVPVFLFGLAVERAEAGITILCDRESPSRTVIAIANKDYNSIAKLENPQRDADAVAKAFVNHGFIAKQAANLTSDQLNQMVADAKPSCSPGMVVLYYAGHGIEIAGRPYIAGIGVAEEKGAVAEMPKGFVALSDLAATLAQSFTEIHVVFDASRGTPFKPAAMPAAISTANLFGDIPEVRSVLFASNADQDPLDADPEFKMQSPFSRAFASQVDADWPDMDVIMARVRSRVSAATKGKQTPDWFRAPALRTGTQSTR